VVWDPGANHSRGPDSLIRSNGRFDFWITGFTYGNQWTIRYDAIGGGDNFATPLTGRHFISLSNLTSIPEPGSLLALGCLVGSGAFLRTRRRVHGGDGKHGWRTGAA